MIANQLGFGSEKVAFSHLSILKSQRSEVVMDALEINYRLRRLGKSQTRLAHDLGVSPGIVNNVIHDRSTCFQVAEYIAELLGKSVNELWPERYVFKPRPSRVRASSETKGGAP
jgi:lambda repressor-like predicted transcriptional regulator